MQVPNSGCKNLEQKGSTVANELHENVFKESYTEYNKNK